MSNYEYANFGCYTLLTSPKKLLFRIGNNSHVTTRQTSKTYHYIAVLRHILYILLVVADLAIIAITKKNPTNYVVSSVYAVILSKFE